MALNNNRSDAGVAAAEGGRDAQVYPGLANETKVGMGDIAVAKAPAVLSIIGLGSCVGVAIYSPKDRIGGLAHIMLPDSTKARNATSREKYADTGLPILLDRLKRAGTDQMWMNARLVGGASMFKTGNPGGLSGGMFNIGENNVRACREFLKKERIKVTGEEVLGTAGRTMRFDVATGRIWVRYADGTSFEL